MMSAALAGCAETRALPEQELATLEDEWSRATVRRDGAALAPFYADEYIFTDPDGVVSDKTQEITEITSGTLNLTSYEFEDLQVHVYGEVAVVTGGNTITGVWEDLQRDMNGTYRFTDVFVRRDGRWQCVASQASRLEP